MHVVRSAFMALVALSVAATLSLALVSAAPTAAQDSLGCPDGFVPSSDGNGCVSEAEGAHNDNITTTTSCLQGVLSDDGTQCLVPRLDAPAPSGSSTSGPSTVAAPRQAFTG